ncbi:MAG: flippase-like domain-containing protein [Anaerolineae bacterium]|nr:flippase-like domain-containing protein [Anaerolineae bacterium]
MREWGKRIARWLALFLGLGFIAGLLRAQWAELRTYTWHLAPGWFLLGFPPLALSWSLEIALWRVCLRSLNGRLSYGRAALIWLTSNFVRYIPGNVWQFVGIAALAAEEGVPAEATLTSLAVHQALSATAVGTLTAAYLAWSGHAEAVRIALAAGALLAVLFVGFRPGWVELGLNRVLRILHRPPLRITLTRRQMAAMLVGYWTAWVLAGLGFAAVVRALTSFPPALIPHLVATFIISYFIGYISLITPGGLGVREGAVVWLLGGWLPAPLPTIASLVGRVWLTLGEVVSAGGALVLWRGRRPLRGIAGAPAATERVSDG